MSSSQQIQNAHAVLQEYNDRIDEAYALNLDASTAMQRWADWLLKQQRYIVRNQALLPGGPKSVEEMDASSFHYGEGDANTPDATVLHQSTQGELKARNLKDGANERALSRMLLITIYQFWEDHYRQAFAAAIGKPKNEITSDFFGDIRYIRHGVIHHRNLATDEVVKCKIWKLFAPNQEIFLTSDQVKLVVRGVRDALDDLSQRYLEINGGFAGRIGVSGHPRI